MEARGSLLDSAEQLVKSVFTEMDLSERVSFWVYRKQKNPFVRLLMRLFGVSSISDTWVAVNDNGDVCGTTGLYAYTKDENEAVWLSWFCVDPKQRGQGIGKQLLRFSIDTARNRGNKYLRLYTSTDSNEAEAQGLYEKFGIKIVKEKKHGIDTYLYRELKL